MNQVKELQELRQRVFGTSKDHIVCQHCKSEVRRDVNLRDNSGKPQRREARKDSTISVNDSRSIRSDATYAVEFNQNTKVALKLNLSTP